MHPAYRSDCWELLRERAKDIDLFIAPSGYCAHLMSERLALPHPRVQVIYNGIQLEGYAPSASPPRPPVLGYFARLCPEKGLETLVEAFLILKQRGLIPSLRLRIGGSLSPSDTAFVTALQERLRRNGALKDAEFCPNLSRADKQAFYRSLTLLSVPVSFGEAFGLYVVEALASGVPVVLPDRGAFPELVRATGGGLLYEPPTGNELAHSVESLLLNETTRSEMALKGREAAVARFGIDRMASEMVDSYRSLTSASR
jgi:glycosyltransferase involved in cell wall biosynthesis